MMDILDRVPEQAYKGGKSGTTAALGFFDGLHLGHIAVIERALSPGMRLCVLSVGEPYTVASGGAVRSTRIIPKSEELRILSGLGTDMLIQPPFESFRDMSGKRFVREVIVGRLGADAVSCGEDFRFGKDAACGVDELRAMGEKYGFECRVCPQISIDGEKVSSTRLRALLTEGRIAGANRLLGRLYGYTIPVVPGLHLARTLGAPTINQPLPEDLYPMRCGVYASRTMLGGKWMYSVTNIGVKPTITGGTRTQPLSETWIPDFSGDLYGESIRVELVDFIRDERVFDSVEQLGEAIHRDGETAKRIASEFTAP